MNYTVKIIHNTGTEHICAGTAVTYQDDTITITTPASEKRMLQVCGVVYVMNENGRNVAVYRIGRARSGRAA